LFTATDTRLSRQVWLQIFPPAAFVDEVGAHHLAWLRALARCGGPRLQRILRIEPSEDGSTRVVYEALVGSTPTSPRLTTAQAEQLRHALSPLHAAEQTHGAVASSIIFTDYGPSLLVAGRLPSTITVSEEQAQLADLARLRYVFQRP
jgi:hypothetical protein